MQTGELAAGCAAQTVLMGSFAKWAAIAGVAAAFLFLASPQIDLAVSQVFYVGHGRFAGHGVHAVGIVRNLFMALYVVAVVATIVGAVVALGKEKRWLGLGATQWIFAALCLSVGPGLIANGVFKENWGRARPTNVLEFEGAKPFTPALIPTRNCERNCSFVSGEASSMFALFFAAAALFRRRPRVLAGAGIVVGGLAGLLRIMQGAHFLSDVVFAGVFMALTVTTLFFLFEARASGGMARVRLALGTP